MGRAKIKAPNTLLLPYQAKWVKDTSRLKIAEKSRQIGWTWASAYSIVRRKSLEDATLDAWVTSRDDEQARLFLEDCKNFANLIQVAATDLGERVYDEKGSTAYALQLANALRIHSMSSNPNAQAGKRGDRILDEFALHPDQRALFGIAYPGVTWGGQLEIFSTHRGSDSLFNKLLLETRAGKRHFSLHRVTLEDALNQGFLDKLQQKLPTDDERQEMDEQAYFDFVKADCVDEEMFNQEYMCIPSNDATAFISYEMLDGNHVPGKTTVERGTVDGKPSEIVTWEADGSVGDADLYLGVDPARHGDLYACWLAADVAGILMPVVVKTMKNVTFSRQDQELNAFMEMKNLRRCCFDLTGLGEKQAEEMRIQWGYRFEPVRFSPATKEAMAYPVRQGLEDKTFKVPNLAAVDSDFRKIRKETTASGNVRFTGERDASGHADRFWAAALCREAKGHRNTQPALKATAQLKEDIMARRGRSRRSFL